MADWLGAVSYCSGSGPKCAKLQRPGGTSKTVRWPSPARVWVHVHHRHHPGTEVGEAVAKALQQVVPERSCPQVYKMGMPTVIFGTNP